MASRISVIINDRPTTVTARYAQLFLRDNNTPAAETVEVGEDPTRPNDSDVKQDWYDYALRTATPEELDGLTKPELIKRYG